jgi:hypothetical protein
VEAKRASGLATRVSYSLADASDSLRHMRLENSPVDMAKINGTLPLSQHVQPSLQTNATFSTGPVLGRWELSASCFNAFNNDGT